MPAAAVAALLILALAGARADDVSSSPPPPSYINLGGNGADSGDCFRDFPHLRQRFSWEQLEFFCQQKRAHDEVVFAHQLSRSPFTPAQRAYLDSLALDAARTPADNPRGVAPERKEIRALGEVERRVFAWTLQALTRARIDGVSKFNLLVLLHHPSLAAGSHVGAAFLPWHREYLRTVEVALKKEHPLFVALPYWDSRLDYGLPKPTDSMIWSERFFGNHQGRVETGPFARQQFVLPNRTEPIPLTRNVSAAGRLFGPSQADFVLGRAHFKQLTACVRGGLRLEQDSRAMHEWVGGEMSSVYYAPQDFIYFLHHAFIDFLWHEQRANQTDDERLYGYPANYEACSQYHYGRAPMRPFEPLQNIDGLGDIYDAYYTYRPVPSCALSNDECQSHYLFCKTDERRCMSKVRTGGDCTGLHAFDACFNGLCDDGICIQRMRVIEEATRSTEESEELEEEEGEDSVEKILKENSGDVKV